METIAVATDSNSGITQEQALALGVRVLPMPFYINGDLFYEDISLTREEFYQRLDEGADISTSQPSPGDVMRLWDEVLRDYDKLIYIPMSSGLSSSCQTAQLLAGEKPYTDRVYVIDNKRISVTQRQSVLDVLQMIRQGMTVDEIVAVLKQESLQASIYITVDTLKYLKRGGRITAVAAAIGTVLNIKPVLQIQGDKLDAFAKVRGLRAAKRVMIDALENDIAGRFAGQKLHLFAAYTCEKPMAETWREEIQVYFPGFKVHMDPLSLSIACHTGKGSMGIGCCRAIA